MFNRLPKLGLSSQDSLYHPHRRKHLIRFIWGMQTKSYSILPSRAAIFFLRGEKNISWPGILLSHQIAWKWLTGFYWQLCNHDITTESVTLTQSKKKMFWCLNGSLSHSESDLYRPWKNLFIRGSVLPGWRQLLWNLWNAQTPRSPLWYCYDLGHLPADSLWTAIHVNEASVFLFVPMPCTLNVEKKKKSTSSTVLKFSLLKGCYLVRVGSSLRKATFLINL